MTRGLADIGMPDSIEADPIDVEPGIEIDKLEISKVAEKAKPARVSEDESWEEPVPVQAAKAEPVCAREKQETPSRGTPFKKKLLAAVISAAVMLALAGVGLFVLAVMTPAYRGGGAKQADAAAFHELEPIKTNLGLGSYVVVVVAVRLDSGKQAAVSASRSTVNDAILTFLWSPELRTRIPDSATECHQTLVEEGLVELLQQHFQNRVVLKGVHVYSDGDIQI